MVCAAFSACTAQESRVIGPLGRCTLLCNEKTVGSETPQLTDKNNSWQNITVTGRSFSCFTQKASEETHASDTLFRMLP